MELGRLSSLLFVPQSGKRLDSEYLGWTEKLGSHRNELQTDIMATC